MDGPNPSRRTQMCAATMEVQSRRIMGDKMRFHCAEESGAVFRKCWELRISVISSSLSCLRRSIFLKHDNLRLRHTSEPYLSSSLNMGQPWDQNFVLPIDRTIMHLGRSEGWHIYFSLFLCREPSWSTWLWPSSVCFSSCGYSRRRRERLSSRYERFMDHN